jgi:hypothetical protein
VCVFVFVCVRVCVCIHIQLDVMGCTASQDAMDEKNKTSNGHYSDEGVFGAEEDFPLSIDEVREGTVWGGLRLKNKRQSGGVNGVKSLHLLCGERFGDPGQSLVLHDFMCCLYIEYCWTAPMGSWG